MAQDRKLQKLELTWVGKYDEQKPLEPRILIENPEYSYGEVEEGVLPNGRPWKGNMLIHGDNLLALKALEQDYSGCVKCIYIDPPYNTGNAFEHYDDGVEHSIWLSLMRERLVLLRNLLSDDGSIWISIDDNEAHYLKVLMDEIFGRRNFIADVAWEKSDSPRMDARLFSSRYDHTLVYSKNINNVEINRFKPSVIPEHYNKIDDNGNRYYLKPLRAMGIADSRQDRPTLYFPLTAPDGTIVYPIRSDGSDGRWRWSLEKIENNPDLIEWVSGKYGWSAYYKIFASDEANIPPETLWTFEEAGSNRLSKQEIKTLFKDQKSFETPKPEKLLQRIIHISTKENDLVFDSFLGSGTTTAVAQKMGRRYIGIELGNHAYTHCYPRMKKVADGTDQGGISKAQNWKGGGGFRFYELAPSLLKEDKFGNLVINKEYNADMLAAAMAKQEGFTYSPSAEQYWKQGYSSETDYIYTTTQFMTVEGLSAIAEQMIEGESLLICCTAFQKECHTAFTNITVKKIPQMLLGRCEFNKDDYSLNIVELPTIEEEYDEDFEEENDTSNTEN